MMYFCCICCERYLLQQKSIIPTLTVMVASAWIYYVPSGHPLSLYQKVMANYFKELISLYFDVSLMTAGYFYVYRMLFVFSSNLFSLFIWC